MKMENKTNNSVTKIMQSSSLLKDYVSKAKTLEKLAQVIKQYLEPELAKNCTVANFVNNNLILATTSAAWNHRLRFLAPDLLSKLRRSPDFYALNKIEVIVYNPAPPQQELADSLPPLKLSPANAKQMLAIADGVGDPNLAAALQRMAERGGK